jgi:hypothetical protein
LLSQIIIIIIIKMTKLLEMRSKFMPRPDWAQGQRKAEKSPDHDNNNTLHWQGRCVVVGPGQCHIFLNRPWTMQYGVCASEVGLSARKAFNANYPT